MNETTYREIADSLRKHPRRLKIIKIVNKAATLLVYCTYPILLLTLIFHRDARFWRVLLVPGISFVLVSAVRRYINAPRPYEVMNITPIISKDTKGNSFPSRHVFSVFIIAMALCYISVPMGIALMLLGVLLALIRVIGGVHFTRDVIAGAVIGILCGVAGFYL